MFRSRSPEQTRWRFALACAVGAAGGALLLTACGSGDKEWEELPGTLELFAYPMPPAAGQELVLGLLATNVGPVDVFQGEQRLATFVRVDLAERVDFRVTAVSAELPRAVAVAYDYERLEVGAVPYEGATPEPEPEPEPGPFAENCPGVVDLSAQECSVEGGAAVHVRVRNDGPNPVSVYNRPVSIGDPSQCILDIKALTASGAVSEFEATAGAVIRVLDDVTIQVVREVRLPEVAACDLVLGP
ncbi:hypothetical protein [Chondromyces apiculatus]|uniref:Lipoprotein n=1 Tax=Chondromyces apiculatus DSM 436 TaxID=1192034 RepID=A0A017TD41_9BACT|nr:hypothetical protein [Chondromyces apiculatus]EYF07203.1 Hypothetical protein CAP_0682 [Chondromyces apiculatus DSM 436]